MRYKEIPYKSIVIELDTSQNSEKGDKDANYIEERGALVNLCFNLT